METLLTIIHVFVALLLIGVVLLQSGRGGGMGAALGGASSQVFGGRGAGNFLTRVTSIAAIVFFLTSLTLSMLSSRERSVLSRNVAPAAAPAADTAAPSEPAVPPATDAATPAPAADAPAPVAPEAAPTADAPAATP